MRLHYLLLVFLSLAAFSAASGYSGLAGGWTPIKNAEDPHVTGIAIFAVIANDLKTGEELRLVKVVKGETQELDDGTNYRLVLAAKVGSTTNNYEAVVFEQAYFHKRTLSSFKPLH